MEESSISNEFLPCHLRKLVNVPNFALIRIFLVSLQLVTRKHGEIQLDGFNPSAEEADEGTDVAVESGVDVVLNHRLCETYAFGDKKAYTAYLKDYMKKLVAKLEEKSPEQVDTFKTNMNKVMKELLGRFKELQFFTGT